MSYPIPTPQAPTPPASQNFSATDGIQVVIRGMATGTECLRFAGRKVTLCLATGAGWLFGGIKGSLRYAHENLGNRSVQPDQHPAHTIDIPTQFRTNPPLEAYVLNDAAASADTLSQCILTTHTRYPWLSGENLGSVAFTFFVPYCLFGPVGAVLFNLPRICGAQPYVNFPASSDGAPHTRPEVARADPQYPGHYSACHSQGHNHNYHQPPYAQDQQNSAHWHN